MSIINEALKKTEQYIQKNTAKENQLADKKISPKAFLLYILILFGGIFLSNLIFSFLNHKIKTTLPKKNAVSLVQKGVVQQTVVPPPPPVVDQPVKPPEEKIVNEVNFVLNGIFYSNNDGYALVNNQIIREGDLIDGVKVNKITEDIVELDNQGKIITLVTQR